MLSGGRRLNGRSTETSTGSFGGENSFGDKKEEYIKCDYVIKEIS